MLSNTGAVSATDWLMTCSTSPVAVCRSSASRVSLNSLAFWIAITAWSAKVLSSAMSLSANGPGGWRVTWMEPMSRPSHISGTIITA